MLTNEEKRVSSCIVESSPTIPQEVTPCTPLDSLNLNWRERDLPERERTRHVHRLHPYLGKFIPQLVEVFLRKYFAPGQTVLDPFCGSGTTLVQANELGAHSIGYDISAFNVLLCRAKLERYDLAQARREVLDIWEKVTRAVQSSRSQLSMFSDDAFAPALPAVDSEYLTTWYAPQALEALLAYRHVIESEAYEYANLLKVILCRSARSARLTTHFDLDFPKRPQTEPYWCYKHSRLCEPTTDALKFIHRYSLDTLARIEAFAGAQSQAQAQVFHADSRRAEIPPVDGVITSPPYVGLIDYHEQHAYAYHLLGLEDQRQAEIGAAARGASQKAQEAYIQDMVQVFTTLRRSLKPGSRLIVVANDKFGLYPRIAELCHLETEAVVQRHVNRRTGRRAGEFYESIFIWRNP